MENTKMKINKSRLEDQIEESYQHIKLYLNDEDECEELHKQCMNCECFCGIHEHDYSECRDKNCFRFYLGYEYLKWSSSYH